MKLMCPEILHILKHKPIMVSRFDLQSDELPITNKRRQFLMKPLMALIQGSQKYIFDSGADRDEKFVMAVRETSVNMTEADLFHQPYPVMWIEDPYEGNGDKQRNFYLCEEKDGVISVWMFFYADLVGFGAKPSFPRLHFHPYKMIIDLAVPEDMFGIECGIDEKPILTFRDILGEAIYSYKKLIVTLNTTNHVMDKVKAHHGKANWNGDPRAKPYDHTVIRIPLEDEQPGEAGGTRSASTKPRRKMLVAGYNYGKNTRPREKWRWVKAYWRGENEVEVVERSHYEVR